MKKVLAVVFGFIAGGMLWIWISGDYSALVIESQKPFAPIWRIVFLFHALGGAVLAHIIVESKES